MLNEGQNWKADGINNLQVLQIENLQQFFSIKPIRRLTTRNYVNLLMAVLFVHSGYVDLRLQIGKGKTTQETLKQS